MQNSRNDSLRATSVHVRTAKYLRRRAIDVLRNVKNLGKQVERNKESTGVVEEPGINLRLQLDARRSDSKRGMRSRCASRHGTLHSHTPAIAEDSSSQPESHQAYHPIVLP
jgi:hypothetical protein